MIYGEVIWDGHLKNKIMDNTLVIWALVIAFLVLAFVGVYIYRLRVVADEYEELKKLSSHNLKDKISRFLDKMDSKQLDILNKALNKK